LGRHTLYDDHFISFLPPHTTPAKILPIGYTAIAYEHPSVFGLLYSTFGALIFYAIEGFSGMFRWTSMTTVTYETIDYEQSGATDPRRYAYLTDRETFLNIGRVTALLLFIAAYTYFPEGTIRYGLMFAVLAQAGMLVLVKKQLAALPQVPLKKVLLSEEHGADRLAQATVDRP
jgi:hypothetical protein